VLAPQLGACRHRHEQQAARSQYAGKLADSGGVIGEMLEQVERENDVDGLGGHGEGFRAGPQEATQAADFTVSQGLGRSIHSHGHPKVIEGLERGTGPTAHI
jgi:hypothetical protein